MDSTSSVQTLIDRFELMAQANTTPAAPRSWSVTGSKRMSLPPQPKSDNSSVKEIIERMNVQRARTQSEPGQMTQKMEIMDVADPAVEEDPEEEDEEAPVATPETSTKPVVYENLTVKTLESDNEDTTTCNFYEDGSDTDSTTTTKSTCYPTIPPSPSSYSTASTGSLDSLLSSLDIFLPDLLQASGDTKPVKLTAYRSRRSSLPEKLQSAKSSKLVPPSSYRRSSLPEKLQSAKSSKLVPPSSYRRTGKSSSTTTKAAVSAAPKSRRSSLYTAKNPPPAAPKPARPRRSSLSAAMVPPPVKSTRRFSAESARGSPAVVTSPRARTHSNSTSVPRYMDYNSSPRFAATKARNVERRRQLEERNRNLAADKAKHLSRTARKSRTPEWQGSLDQVSSRLLDSKEDNQSRSAKTKTTSSRRHSASSHVRV